MQKKVCIIGGGISGLSQAYFIKQLNPDLKIMILEKENYLGGCMQSQNID
jgi:oxygen-dependent protoporphyrinogen oxidase